MLRRWLYTRVDFCCFILIKIFAARVWLSSVLNWIFATILDFIRSRSPTRKKGPISFKCRISGGPVFWAGKFMKDKNLIFTLQRKFDTIKTWCDAMMRKIDCGDIFGVFFLKGVRILWKSVQNCLSLWGWGMFGNEVDEKVTKNFIQFLRQIEKIKLKNKIENIFFSS